MGPEIVNNVKGTEIQGDLVGRDKITNIIFFQEPEREFVVTHNANIKPVSYFIGRETELCDLRRRVEEGRKSVLVSGMGGIGKTHICRKLFEEYLTGHAKDGNVPFSHIGYVEYSGDMDSSLQKCLKFKAQERQEDNRKAAWEELVHLASGGKLLLFIDNVDKALADDPGLQNLKDIPGAIVLTSRQASFDDEFEVYPIGFLSIEQCKEIYEKIRYKGSTKKVRAEEAQDLEYVIEHLAGRHTITVEFLANLACIKHWTVKRLRKELEEKGFCLQFHKAGELVNIQKSYEVLYDLSGLTEAEQNILEAFSVFPYISLAAETCNEWLLADAGASEDDDILMGLHEKGWLQFDVESESFALHPVFAQFIYEKCRPVLEKHMGLIESCKVSLTVPESGSAAECQIFIPFAENIAEKIDMDGSIEEVKFIGKLAYLLQYIAKYKQAEELYKKSLRIIEKVFGEEHPVTASNYNNLAGVYESQGEYGQAKEFSEKSLQISRKVLGEEHPYTAMAYHNLAYLHGIQGQFKQAEELFEKSLRIKEKVLGEEHPETASGYYDLAGLYYKQGKYKRAKELYERSLRIREKVLGEEHPDIAAGYHDLGAVYHGQGEYKQAEELYGKSLRIREKVLGEEHPDTAKSYHNLANLYMDLGAYKQAEEFYAKSLRIREKVLGEGHPVTARSYHNLANLYKDQGNYKQAEELYGKSLRIMEQALGTEHPDTAMIYNSLANLYRNQGKHKQAEEFDEKSLRIREKVLGEEHPDTAVGYHSLAGVYYERGEYKQAEKFYTKSLQINEKVLGKGHPDTALAYCNLAVVYDSQGEYKQAEEMYQKSLRIREKALGEENPYTAMSYNNLGGFYFRQGNNEFALVYSLKAYKIFRKTLGLEHPHTNRTYENIKMLYAEYNPESGFEQWLEYIMKE